MTPTAQIAAIRQRAENAKEIGAVSVAWSQDIPFLLQQIDARESALRALVAQWREEAAFQHRAVDVLARELRGHQNSDTVVYLHRAHADAINSCADAVERLLESEQ